MFWCDEVTPIWVCMTCGWHMTPNECRLSKATKQPMKLTVHEGDSTKEVVKHFDQCPRCGSENINKPG